MKLPIYQSQDRAFMDMQTNWSAYLNPALTLPTNSGILLKNIRLVSGDNSINHLLGRPLQGWDYTRMRGVFVQLYDKQDSNQLAALTLVLNSNGACTVDLFVF